jgi:hypothetical protein
VTSVTFRFQKQWAREGKRVNGRGRTRASERLAGTELPTRRRKVSDIMVVKHHRVIA